MTDYKEMKDMGMEETRLIRKRRRRKYMDMIKM